MTLDRAVDLPPFGWKKRKPSLIPLADRARDVRQWELAAHLNQQAFDRDPHTTRRLGSLRKCMKESGELRDLDKLAQGELSYRRYCRLMRASPTRTRSSVMS